MGFTDCPYHACQEVTWDKTIAIGNRRDSMNPFRWERVVVNFQVHKDMTARVLG